jgi:hypothetical protein
MSGQAGYDAWAEVLEPGETPLWQGRPEARLFITLSQAARLIRTILMIALFFYILARLQKTIPTLWDVRAIVLFIFFQAVPSEMLRSLLRRRRSDYLLTNRRAVMRLDQSPFGQRIYEVRLAAATTLETTQRGDLLSIFFPSAPKRGWSLLGEAPMQGFERLREGRAVLALIHRAQSDALAARAAV